MFSQEGYKMEPLIAYNAYTQSNDLSGLQNTRIGWNGYYSPVIDVLFIIFVILIVAYFIWTRESKR